MYKHTFSFDFDNFLNNFPYHKQSLLGFFYTSTASHIRPESETLPPLCSVKSMYRFIMRFETHNKIDTKIAYSAIKIICNSIFNIVCLPVFVGVLYTSIHVLVIRTSHASVLGVDNSLKELKIPFPLHVVPPIWSSNPIAISAKPARKQCQKSNSLYRKKKCCFNTETKLIKRLKLFLNVSLGY